jgi:hypothetical protein
MPMAITKSATSLELSRKTGPRIFVEKYMTNISHVTIDPYLARFRRLVGQIVRLQPHTLVVSRITLCKEILTRFPNHIILGFE